MNTRQEYLGGATSGSIAATDRLMRELKDIYRSQNLKDSELILLTHTHTHTHRECIFVQY